MSHLVYIGPDCAIIVLQVAARTETGVRRRTQAMSRSCSKRKSRFSSLWGLDTTSKKKTKAHPTVSQVCVPPSSYSLVVGFRLDHIVIYFPLSKSSYPHCSAFVLFFLVGLCWWWAGEEACWWHVCWSPEGKQCKEEWSTIYSLWINQWGVCQTKVEFAKLIFSQQWYQLHISILCILN